MKNDPFTAVDSGYMVHRISQASRKVCYAAPGVHCTVAESLASTAELLGWPQVQIVVDMNPEVCRLGYGDITAIELLQSSGCQIRSCPGLRLGLLIVDEDAWVFSPTPLYLEDEPHSLETPNAIVVEVNQAERLLEAVAPRLADPTKENRDPAIGHMKVTSEEICRAMVELKSRPPVAADLARQMRVLTGRFQIVRIQLIGIYWLPGISARSVHNVGIRDRDLQKHLSKSCRTLSEGFGTIKSRLQEHLRELCREHLVSLDYYGTALRFDQRAAFESAVEALQRDVDECKKHLGRILQAHLAESRDRLKHFLVENLDCQADGSSQTRLFNVDICHPYVNEEVERIIEKIGFPKAQKLVEELECHYHFLSLSEQGRQMQTFVKLLNGVSFA